MPKTKPARRFFSPRLIFLLTFLILLIVFLADRFSSLRQSAPTPASVPSSQRQYQGEPLALPAPSKQSRMSIEQALNQRRSRRAFLDKSLSLKQLSQLLWSLQGVTADWGGRTTPSAKSAYPLEIYALALNVDGLESGVYHYIPGDLKPVHQIGLIKKGDFKQASQEAAKQSSAKDAPVILIIAADFSRMAKVFDGKPNDNNVYLEAGHAAENLYLQVESLGLGTVVTGGFDQAKTAALINLPSNETLIYLIPVGYPK